MVWGRWHLCAPSLLHGPRTHGSSPGEAASPQGIARRLGSAASEPERNRAPATADLFSAASRRACVVQIHRAQPVEVAGAELGVSGGYGFITAEGSATWSIPSACIVSCTTSHAATDRVVPLGWTTTPVAGPLVGGPAGGGREGDEALPARASPDAASVRGPVAEVAQEKVRPAAEGSAVSTNASPVCSARRASAPSISDRMPAAPAGSAERSKCQATVEHGAYVAPPTEDRPAGGLHPPVGRGPWAWRLPHGHGGAGDHTLAGPHLDREGPGVAVGVGQGDHA